MDYLVIVDVQNDFINGSLAVPKAEEIIPHINELLKKDWDFIVVSKDSHPETHTSFAKNNNVADFTSVNGEMKWPVHCIEQSEGSRIHKDITIPLENVWNVLWVYKGQEELSEQYSAVEDSFKEILDGEDEKQNFTIVGLATDFCVKETAKDLASLGHNVSVDLRGCRGVNPETTAQAINQLKELGVNII